MRVAGLDIGSRAIKLALVEDRRLTAIRVTDTTFDPLAACAPLVRGVEVDRWVATGYGRHLFAAEHRCEVVTEIKAVATGARAVSASCRTVLDLGGQDTKAISLDTDGRTAKFAMNDRCAAGTGRFLEVMAAAMALPLDDLVRVAATARRAQPPNSMCAVFAETEVISMVARGVDRAELALGIHAAAAKRTVSLLNRVPIVDDLLFVGGGALNSCLCDRIGALCARTLHVPAHPQTVAAFGAALCAFQAHRDATA